LKTARAAPELRRSQWLRSCATAMQWAATSATSMTKSFARVEHLLLVAGVVLLSACLAIVVYGSTASRLALWEFDRAQAATVRDGASVSDDEESEFPLWDKRRIQSYRDSLLVWVAPPVAALSIEKLRLRVPVFEGTDDVVLNRGAGWITGTARPEEPGNPGEPGNIGIAGHRDGFFRGLKDIEVGDRIDLTASGRTLSFTVDEIRIVAPTDVHVLQPRSRPSLTLVTCYPFYFVGSAPQRYIVHASVVETTHSRNTNTLPAAEIEGRIPEDRK
jgi:sortase A